MSECGEMQPDGTHEFHCYYGGSCTDIQPKVCSASGDPHYITFDGAKFDFMAPGYFWLVRSETVQIQAHIVNCPCHGSPSTQVGAQIDRVLLYIRAGCFAFVSELTGCFDLRRLCLAVDAGTDRMRG